MTAILVQGRLCGCRHCWQRLSKDNAGDIKANNTENMSPTAPSTPTSGHRCNPCKHDWFLAKCVWFQSSKSLCTRTVNPQPRPWLIPQQPIPAPPRPKGTLVGMTGAEIGQSRPKRLGPEISQARTPVLFVMIPTYTDWGVDPHGPPTI